MKKPRQPSAEHALLTRLGKLLGPAAAAGGAWPLTLGDDAAVRLCRLDERLIVTADVSVENVHFTTESMSFAEIGFRAMASNVSDCAAMGARPDAAIVQLVFPRDKASGKNAESLYRGFAEACRKWNFRLVGGDLSGGPCWTIGITLIGSVPGDGRPVTRRGILAGDTLLLGGFPGRSAAGFAVLQAWGRKNVPARYRSLVRQHVRPEPDLELGLALGRNPAVHAMMDLSDGISKDAATLCFENRLGLELSLDELKPPDDMVALGSELGIPWQEWVLHGGEEYELLVAEGRRQETGERRQERREERGERREERGKDEERMPLSRKPCVGAGFPRPDVGDSRPENRPGMVRLGTFTDGRQGVWVRTGGKLKRLAMKSWDHAGPLSNR